MCGFIAFDFESEKKLIQMSSDIPDYLKKQFERAFEFHLTDTIGVYWLSTVRKPLCGNPVHMWRCGGERFDCIMYETLVRGPSMLDVVDEYTTEDEARRGHSRNLGIAADICSRRP